MTAVQLNTMNTELWQSIGAIADSESLMKRLTRYAKKLVKEREADPTLMTKEEFFRPSTSRSASMSGANTSVFPTRKR